jgi:hypothetical protein
MPSLNQPIEGSGNTIKEQFRRLVEIQQLALYGNRKDSWYALK